MTLFGVAVVPGRDWQKMSLVSSRVKANWGRMAGSDLLRRDVPDMLEDDARDACWVVRFPVIVITRSSTLGPRPFFLHP